MDTLTKLPTHLDLPSALPALRGPDAAPLTGIVFDIDGLIWINAQHGFQKGAATLVQVASWLAARAQQHNAQIFRVSGDEFLFLLPRLSLEDALALAGDIVRACESLRIPYRRRSCTRDFLALNAVVFAAPAGFERGIPQLREAWADAIYAGKTREGKTHSLVALMTPAG